MSEIQWRRVNDEPYEYAIQQGPHGDEFVKLLDGSCLRRPQAWQPIETAPKDTPIIVWGYRTQGEAALGGPYKYFWRTIGQIDGWGSNECRDLLDPGCDCIRRGIMPHPMRWMSLPDTPHV